MVLRTEALTYLLKGTLVFLCLAAMPATADNYRQDPAQNAFYSENSAHTGRRTARRHITEEYAAPEYTVNRGYRYERERYPAGIRRTPRRERKDFPRVTSKYEKRKRRKAKTLNKRKRYTPAENRGKKRYRQTRYRIKRGDTLYGIARKHGMTVTELRRLNGISSGNRIKYGQILKVGGKKRKKSAVRGASYRAKKRKSTAKSPGKPAFTWPLRRVTGYHRDSTRGVKAIGLVIKSRPGAAVYSSAAGTVRHIGYMRGYGNFIIVQHRGRYITVYSNLDNIRVSRGEKIRRGGVIGRVGTDRKLHFQIDYAGKPKNPLRYLPRKG